MKYKYFSLIFLSGFLTSTSVLIASADEGASSANSQAKVEFFANDDPVYPDNPEVIDPSDPEDGPQPIAPDPPNENPDSSNPDIGSNNPFYPDDNTNNGVGGSGTKSFNINWASNFNFGTFKITGDDLLGYAYPLSLDFNNSTVTNLAPFVQVVDNRGVSKGWDLTVRSTPMYSDNNEELKGAEILFKDMTVSNGLSSIQNESSLENAPLLSENLTNIISDDDQLVMSSDMNTGDGVWNLSFNNNSNISDLSSRMKYVENTGVIFTLPGSTLPKSDVIYSSDIYWTLNATP